MQKHKKTIFWVSIIVISSVFMFVLRLGLFNAGDVRQGQLDRVYLVLQPLPEVEQQSSDLGAGEVQILNITRQLYEAGVLRDGHKAKAVSYYDYQRTLLPAPEGAALATDLAPQHLVGLKLKQDQYQEASKKQLPGLIYLELPPGEYLRTSVPRLNVLSLRVARSISLPALEEAALEKQIAIRFRLEVYDKQIRFFIPLPEEGGTPPSQTE